MPCKFVSNFRRNTFFDNSKLTLNQILGFCHLWVNGNQGTFIANELRISKRIVVDWGSFCREVLVKSLYENPEKLGGPGKVVEIDESKFGRRKYHRGHRVEGQWVFGGYERGTKRVFLEPVEQR